MSVGDVSGIMASAIFQILILSGPILLIALVVGLVIGILQATTSIQEQTLTFVPKIAAIMLALALLAGWMFSTLGEYTKDLFSLIPGVAG